MPTYFLWFLFDWRGRIGTYAYRISTMVLGLFMAALKLLPDQLHNLLLGVFGAQLLIQASLDAKRLHDIGWSAIWVPLSSIACIFGAAALNVYAPGLLAMIADDVFDMLGPALSKGGVLPIVVYGLSAAAVARASMLLKPESTKSGDRYDYTPRGKDVGGDDHKAAATAEALIAKALAEKQAQALLAAGAGEAITAPTLVPRAQPRAVAPTPARKSFGMRKSA